MTDPAEVSDAARWSFEWGEVTFDARPGGRLYLAVYHDGDAIEAGEYPTNVFSDRTRKGEFLNNVEEAMENRNGVAAEAARADLREWCADMSEKDKEEQEKFILTDAVQQLIDGTAPPVEIHGGETSKWVVELTFAGWTRELEFTASEWQADNPKPLREKLTNKFYEVVELEEEDWKAVRDRWQEQAEVVDVVPETATDAVADRVLQNLRDAVHPVSDRERMANDPRAAWYDEQNAVATDAAPADAAILWIQARLVDDQLDSIGKSVEYKSQLIQTLNQRGDLHGTESDGRRKWGWDTRRRVYPFVPERLGVDADDVVDAAALDDPHSEVSA